jgi:hypothetical protein
MTPIWLLLTSVGAVLAVVVGTLDVGGVYIGALVLPERPLVVAPHPMVAITLASAAIRITPDMGFFSFSNWTDAQVREFKATPVPVCLR